ncbi:N-carbamoyl-D-amino-acid hydrolase [Aquisalimonas asiatica]|uniref:Predicted amidohydrolase n=1 Tax=Aquisalimonas asiatica TaxID=406100 RepID=A0A1H8RI39_9GAMM|nr:N-carbamoyl-D-amino-acid hydrolase [Aquisalimonas asiatica]SEO66075.1 Predicted amidohydrolase [Aquisalimonas asiatica]
MSRYLDVAAAQMGPVARDEPRSSAVRRMITLMREARARGADLVVYPELALTTFFPRWVIDDESELDAFFETEMPGRETAPLFEESARLGISFYLGYAELVREGSEKRRFNTSIFVDGTGTIAAKYRKVHLPGHDEPQAGRTFQHLEKRYFRTGDLGFPVWHACGGLMGMCLCNDRRWPETYRVMGLQGVELIMLGYNTPVHHTGYEAVDALAGFHNHLSVQAGAYQNATWVVATAKGGTEEGSEMIAQSAIVAPSGEIVAMASTRGDEVITARCDLDLGRFYRETIFDFERHREPSAYGLIVERKGARPPDA